MSKTPEKFGTGMIEGVAGPEAANNGATAGAMVPLLSLGIPFSPATAILLGALVVHGLQPGPLMISQRPEVFWGFVASMYIGNLMLLILNLPLVGVFVTVLRLPQHILATLVLLLCLVGAFSLSNSFLDLWVLVIFGVFGYALRKLRVDPSPDGGGAGAGPDDGEDAAPGALHHARQRRRSRGAPAVGDDPDPRRRRALRAAARTASARETLREARFPRVRAPRIRLVPGALTTRHGRSTMRRSGLSPVRPGSPVVRMSCHGEPRLGRGRSWE